MNRLSQSEMRDIAIAEKTAAHVVAIRAKVAAGEPPIALIADGVTDLLCNAELAQRLVRTAACAAAEVGPAFGALVEQVIADQAEVEAKKDVAQMERDRQESHDAGRIERAVYDQNMALFGWGGMS